MLISFHWHSMIEMVNIKIDPNYASDYLRFTTTGVKDYITSITPTLNTMHLLEVTFKSDYDADI